MARRYWLFKSEPGAFSWEDLVACPEGTTFWDGVRNYQARNLLRDEIKPGDRVFFYHSRCHPPEIVGTATVTRGGAADPTQFDPASPYADPASKPESPRWYGVEIRADRALKRPVSLAELKQSSELQGMMVTRRGARLSIQPVRPEEWKAVLALSRRPRTPP